ncbi:MAG TPA: dihydroorotase [Candidatus Binataceae bacterium]|nr:dihydroorotase [Candidatus Binataceae bacterium]
MTSIVISGGRVIDPGQGLDGNFDVLVVDGLIEEVAPAGHFARLADAHVIDAAGKWVLPGLIDPHVHLRDPGFPEKETIESGLRAAAAGGFTTVAAMANTSPVNDSPEITRYMLDAARRAGGTRLVPVSAVTRGLEGRELVDGEAMAAAGARLFSDDGLPVDDEPLLLTAYDQVNRLGLAISLHEEDRELSRGGAINQGEIARQLGVRGIPDSAESRRVGRDLALAIGNGAAVHIAHVSSAQSLQMIRAARNHGANVTCEVTPHHFSLDESAVLRCGTDAKMNPPLREGQDVAALEAALSDSTIDMIATDHAPHDPGSKQPAALAGCFPFHANHDHPLNPAQADAMTRAPNGVIGLETALGLALRLVHRSIISAARMVELMALNPARLLRLEAGTLAAGAAADVTIVDPELRWTVDAAEMRSKSRNTPFAGMKLVGRATMTIVSGKIIYSATNGAASR